MFNAQPTGTVISRRPKNRKGQRQAGKERENRLPKKNTETERQIAGGREKNTCRLKPSVCVSTRPRKDNTGGQ